MNDPKRESAPADAGRLEPTVRPHVWVVEWGAISLPLGDPSRVTCKSTWDTFEEAEEALFQARQEFTAHMYQAVPVHGGGMPAAYRCIAPLCETLDCRACNCAVPADVYAVLMRAERSDLGETAARDAMQRTNLALLADENDRLRAALALAVAAMRAPFDGGWKGEVERKALDVAADVLGPNGELK